MNDHDAAVKHIAAKVQGFHDRGVKFRIYHGSTNSTRTSPYQKDKIIDTSQLNHVLTVDKEKKTALVEPNVSMDVLLRETMKANLVPPVVMELPGITVGGGFAGMSGESSSFKHGIFDCTINSLEIVLANGSIVHASHTSNQDLFNGAAGSCGTLGVITLLELQLIDAKKYVELSYHPVSSTKEAIEKSEELMRDPSVEYIDAILFSSTSGVVMTGHLTDAPTPNTPIQTFLRRRDPWFYIHAQRLIARQRKKGEKSEPARVAIPLPDYFFRYDRGAFWGGLHAFKYFMTPFNRITRYLLDHFMHTRVMFHAFHAAGLGDQTIVQDVAVPLSKVEEFVKYLDDSLGSWPLWLCPVRGTSPSHPDRQSFSQGTRVKGDQLLMNVGVWCMGPKDYAKFVSMNRDIEAEVEKLGGLKCLYAHAYYTEEEFWKIYDREWYEELRKKYGAEGLPSVYDKVISKPRETGDKGKKTLVRRVKSRVWGTWPISGLYGVYKAAFGGEYLLKR
ncbi:FAD-binding domain-containing protein [Aulographum hederae CBS 113979]|uniref:Delta(24)-sterol reductase n=1 Tax=Aulographum hederae CBS 113979 TaxID=1176131 RepID=A0A6G1GU18_9PEZI|nr:FAD-binding domain-containing protein [Aulographum hederae CBS 113979]